MKNPLLVFLISLEHQMPSKITEVLSKLYKPIYPDRFEKYCVVCGMRYTYDWWELES